MSRILGAFGAAAPDLLPRMLAALGGGAYEGELQLGSLGGSFARRGRVAVALDGRIYNRRSLGSGRGSDAELVADLFLRHGLERALALVNGDFALALQDERDGSLWLARDRLGVRPLYWARSGEAVAFASRPRPLLALPGVRREPDPRYLALVAGSHYRTFDNEPGRSPYLDVAQVPAAHALRFRDGSVSSVRWWSLADAPDLELPDEALAERYRELLLDAVALRLEGAAAPAFTLSGGMDSSSVLSCAVAVAGERQVAYSTVYDDPTYDESDDIRSILAEKVADWRRVAIGTPDVLDLVARMVAAHDEPVATATWLSHYLLCERAAADGTRTLFGGLGGDELNAGEYEYFLLHFADLRAAGRDAELAHEVAEWARHHDHPVFRKDAAIAEAGLARLVDPTRPGRVLPDRERIERYAAAVDPSLFDLRAYEPVMEAPSTSYLLNRTWQDISRETLPCCLRAEDRHGEAFGVRHVLPYLDHRLVELMFRVPGRLKIRNGVTKRLAREAMRGLVPEETRTRVKKTGWNAPAHVWFSGAGAGQVRDLVRSQRFRERGVYVVPEVERLLDEHERIVASGEPRENHMMFLWQLVNVELWLQELERG